jgi:hypothetical protein
MFLFWLRTPPRMGRRVNQQASRSGIAPGLDEMPLVRSDGLRGDVDGTAHPHRLQVPGPDEPTVVASDSGSLPATTRTVSRLGASSPIEHGAHHLYRVVESSANSYSDVETPARQVIINQTISGKF